MKSNFKLLVILGGFAFSSLSLFAEPIITFANSEFRFDQILSVKGKVIPKEDTNKLYCI